MAKRIEILRRNGQSGGHRVSAVFDQKVVAFAQRGGEIKSLNAATGTAPGIAFPADDNARTIKFLKHARGDNSNNSHLPQPDGNRRARLHGGDQGEL